NKRNDAIVPKTSSRVGSRASVADQHRARVDARAKLDPRMVRLRQFDGTKRDSSLIGSTDPSPIYQGVTSREKPALRLRPRWSEVRPRAEAEGLPARRSRQGAT